MDEVLTLSSRHRMVEEFDLSILGEGLLSKILEYLHGGENVLVLAMNRLGVWLHDNELIAVALYGVNAAAIIYFVYINLFYFIDFFYDNFIK